jgi:hypothetical protein
MVTISPGDTGPLWKLAAFTTAVMVTFAAVIVIVTLTLSLLLLAPGALIVVKPV